MSVYASIAVTATSEQVERLGATPHKGEWCDASDGLQKRHLHDTDLSEIGFPLSIRTTYVLDESRGSGRYRATLVAEVRKGLGNDTVGLFQLLLVDLVVSSLGADESGLDVELRDIDWQLPCTPNRTADPIYAATATQAPRSTVEGMLSPHLTMSYDALLDDHSLTLPPNLLRRLWASAYAARDQNRMSALIARADAPEDLVKQFAAETSARSRVAYLSRPGLAASEAVTVAETETRVSVLAALAGSAATPPELFEILCEQMQAQESVQLANALLRSEHTPSAARLKVLTFLDGRDIEMTRTLYQGLTTAVGLLTDEDATTAVLTLKPEIVGLFAIRVGLSTEARLRLVNEYLDDLCHEKTSGVWFARNYVTDILPTFVALPDLQVEAMCALDALLDQPDVRIDAVSLAAYRSTLLHRSGGLLDPRLSHDAREKRRESLTIASSTATDPTTLNDMAASAIVIRDLALVALLAANPATPVAWALALVDLLDSEANIRSSYTAQRGHVGRDPVRLSLLVKQPDLLAPPGAGETAPSVASLADFDDPSAAAVALCAGLSLIACTNETSSQRGVALEALVRLVTDPLAAHADAAGSLPWPAARNTLRTSSWRSERAPVIERFARLQEEVLADDETAWATFDRLEDDFTGSMADLFTTVTAIAADAAS